MRRARREVPLICRGIHTTRYKTFVMKTVTDTILTVYQEKPGTHVIILSTLHLYINIGTDKKVT